MKSYPTWKNWVLPSFRTRSDRLAVNCGMSPPWCSQIQGRPYYLVPVVQRHQPTTDQCHPETYKSECTCAEYCLWRRRLDHSNCEPVSNRRTRGRRCMKGRRGRDRAAYLAMPDRHPNCASRLGTSDSSTVYPPNEIHMSSISFFKYFWNTYDCSNTYTSCSSIFSGRFKWKYYLLGHGIINSLRNLIHETSQILVTRTTLVHIEGAQQTFA